jgi:DNA-binding MarR family transcriptional regulator
MRAELLEAFFTLSRLMKENMTYDSHLLHLSLLQLQTLVYIKRNPKTQMSDIATKFTIELPSATSLIAKLVAIHLVEKTPDKNDKRIVRLSLTKKGETLLAEATEKRNKKMDELLKYLSEEDKKSLLDILKRLIIKMEDMHEK